MGRGREPHDQDARRPVAEPRSGPTPIRLSRKGSTLGDRDVFAPLDKAGAGPAYRNARIERG